MINFCFGVQALLGSHNIIFIVVRLVDHITHTHTFLTRFLNI